MPRISRQGTSLIALIVSSLSFDAASPTRATTASAAKRSTGSASNASRPFDTISAPTVAASGCRRGPPHRTGARSQSDGVCQDSGILRTQSCSLDDVDRHAEELLEVQQESRKVHERSSRLEIDEQIEVTRCVSFGTSH